MPSNENNFFSPLHDIILELKKQRLINYKLSTIEISSLLIIIGSMLLSLSSFFGIFPELLKYFSQFFLSAGVGVIVAGILQAISYGNLRKTLSEEISAEVIRNIKQVGERMLPSKMYRPTDRDLIQETKRCLEGAGLFRFMSISGLDLITKRLPASVNEIRRTVTIKLLLSDPRDEDNLEIRTKQMRIANELKTIDDLKSEIILCIISTFCLKSRYNFLNIQLRLHREPPICRLEFCGDGNLFLQYYRSQESTTNLGPVLKYEGDRDVYISFEDYFCDVWERSKESKIIIDDINRGSEIKQRLESVLGPGFAMPIENIDSKNLTELCELFTER